MGEGGRWQVLQTYNCRGTKRRLFRVLNPSTSGPKIAQVSFRGENAGDVLEKYTFRSLYRYIPPIQYTVSNDSRIFRTKAMVNL